MIVYTCMYMFGYLVNCVCMCGLAVVLAFWSTTGIYWNQFDHCRPSLYAYLDIPHHALKGGTLWVGGWSTD